MKECARQRAGRVSLICRFFVCRVDGQKNIPNRNAGDRGNTKQLTDSASRYILLQLAVSSSINSKAFCHVCLSDSGVSSGLSDGELQCNHPLSLLHYKSTKVECQHQNEEKVEKIVEYFLLAWYYCIEVNTMKISEKIQRLRAENGGDSMDAAGIKDGYTVIVRRQDIVENGQIAVCIIDGQDATLKRFSQIGNVVTLMPQSTNPEHKPFIYDLGRNSVKILGLVVEAKFSVK